MTPNSDLTHPASPSLPASPGPAAPLTRKLVRQLREWEVALGDRLLGISTLGLGAGALPERAGKHSDALWYQSKDYLQNWQFLRPLHLSKKDVVFDVGCGAGRLLFVAALLGCGRCVGIELSPSLCDLARTNARRSRFHRAKIEIHDTDAATADYSSGTVYCFCNPFGPETLTAVLERIHQSVAENPRSITLVYIHAPEDHHAVFTRATWLKRVSERRFWGAGKVWVTYYRHEP